MPPPSKEINRGFVAALDGVWQALATELGVSVDELDREVNLLGFSMGTATGLDRIGEVTVFEQPHTGGNYLLREMIFVVARKHVQKLRVIALVLVGVVPTMTLVRSRSSAAAPA